MGRTFHSDSRTWSNFQPQELVKLCGVAQGRWPVYVVKELLDNAVAALEEQSTKNPMVRIVLDDAYIEVGENGGGIPDEVLDKILDFERFGGSNKHHKLPTRGAQGNAIMTLVGIAKAWDPDEMIIVTRPCGDQIGLDVQTDPIRQEVGIHYVSLGPPGRSSIRIPLPELPWKRGGSEMDEVAQVVRQFAWMNPHVTFMIRDRGRMAAVPMDPDSGPALDGNPSCGAVSWFTNQELADRLAADVRARPGIRLSEWLSEFAYSSVRSSEVMGAFGSNETIDEMVDGSPMGTLVGRIWKFVREATNTKRADDPRFEPIGGDRLADFLSKEMGADPEVPFEYKAMKGTFGAGVPYLVEVCLVQMPEGARRAPETVLAMNRTVLYGSPSFKRLTWREKVRGQWRGLAGDLGAMSRAYQIDFGKTPAAVVVHVTCPSPGYSGYGKQQFDTTWLCEPLSACYDKVTLQVRKQRAGQSKRRKVGQESVDNIRETVFKVLPGVLHENTEGGKLPIMIRQLYYATRKAWHLHHHKSLNYQTFCVYASEYEVALGHQVCLRDPRGTLIEPHSGRELRLGTDAVARYNPKRWEGHTIIFVEKEGFAHLLKAYKVTKRWDAIIIGSKGFAVESCREVLQKYRKLLGDVVKIICLHDADPAGYMIGYDLANNLPRFGDNVDVQVIDVGLTIEDSTGMGLQDEPFPLKKSVWSMVKNMRRKFIKDPGGSRRPLLEEAAYDAFMPDMYRDLAYPTWASSPRGRRVELNAMSPRQFVSWLEEHLEANDCRKVRPPDAIVDKTLRDAREHAITKQAGELFMRLLGDDVILEVMGEIGVPAHDLDAVLEASPELHWEYLTKRAGETGEDVGAAVEKIMKRKMPEMFK